MGIRDQKRDVIALALPSQSVPIKSPSARNLYLYSLPPQDKKCLRPLRQEPCKLMHQNMLDLIRLFDLNTDAYTVDTGLD